MTSLRETGGTTLMTRFSLFGISALVLMASCCVPPTHGIKAVQSPNGNVLYFRREVRGLNFDSLELSDSDDVCTAPTDGLRFIAQDHPVFYEFDGETLHLHTTSPVESLGKGVKGNKIVIHDLSNPDFIALSEHYRERGLEVVEVPLDRRCIMPFVP